MSFIDPAKDFRPVPTSATGEGFIGGNDEQTRQAGSGNGNMGSGVRTLSKEDGPLVWIDCEMTGLDHETDIIIEIAIIITDGELTPVEPDGLRYVIKTEKEVLDGMGEWCVEQHGRSGLTQECLSSPHTFEHVYVQVVKYVQSLIPEKGVGVLAGSSVHADARFLRKYMPLLLEHLHYRIVDVSSIKEVARRWYPARERAIGFERAERAVKAEEAGGRSGDVVAHRALDDIKASIAELQRYRDEIFLSEKEYLARARRARTWTGSAD